MAAPKSLPELSEEWETANPPPANVTSGLPCGCGTMTMVGPNGGHPRDGKTGERGVTDFERVRLVCREHGSVGSVEEFILLEGLPGRRGHVDASPAAEKLRSKRGAIDAAKALATAGGGPRWLYKLVAAVDVDEDAVSPAAQPDREETPKES